MAAFTLLLVTLLATYLPAVAGARGRGSRGLWIGCIFIGLFIGIGGMMIAKDLFWYKPQDAFAWGGVKILIFQFLIRAAIGFGLGSFLASLLFRKRQPDEQLRLS